MFVALSMQYSCTKTVADAEFKDVLKYSAYDYLVENKADYSSFIQILKAGGIDQALSAYNPTGDSYYTVFAPNNKAVDDFIKENGQYSSLDDLLKDKAYVSALARYHVLEFGTTTNEFPFGAFSQPTLTGDFLNVNFILGTDTTYYKINNQAPVTKTNIKVSNGYIHEIGAMLVPITLNSYGWLKRRSDYSILTAAIEATEMNKIIDVDMKLKDQTLRPFTMLVEPDAVFKKRNINSFDDLAKAISPDRTDYTNSTNPLNQFVGYHILKQKVFLNDIVGNATNYNTFADIPLNINGKGIDIVINKGKEIFDETIVNGDTTKIDFVGINYDASNIVTQSGSIHLIDQVLKPQVPSRADVTFEFLEEPILDKYRLKIGTYQIEDHTSMKYITWSGAELYYLRLSDNYSTKCSKADCLEIFGDFTISYQMPKIIQGKYNVILCAYGSFAENAIVEMSIDGNKIGASVDLTKNSGGWEKYPFFDYNVGVVDLKKYDTHVVQVKTLIPGVFVWDFIRFEPI